MPHVEPPVLLVLLGACLLSGCSGMGTTMSRVGRMGSNQGYEIQAGESTVKDAAEKVLKARGYEVSFKPDPQHGAEGAGLIVIGQRKADYHSVPDPAAPTAPATTMGTRELVDVYLQKKWQMGSDLAAPGITLVDIVGGSYLRRSADADEQETPLTDSFKSLLRDEIVRQAQAMRADKAAGE